MIDLESIFGDPQVADEIHVQPAAEMALEWIEPDEDAAPRPCPRCGGSDLWENLLGVWRCQHCDAAALQRSRSLAEKAARLRNESQRQRLAASSGV
jgi:ribosomal protein L37AE/L43A